MNLRRLSTTVAATGMLTGAALLATGAPALAASQAPTSLSATGNGGNEVPAGSGDEGASIMGSFQLTPAGVMTYTVEVSGSDEPVAAGHIHRGAAGANGDVVVPLDTAVLLAGGTGTVQVEPALAAEILADPAGFYLNTHSASFAPPTGVARAQLSAGSSAPGSIETGSGGQAAKGAEGVDGAAWAAGAAALVAVGAVTSVRRRRSAATS